MIGDPDYLYEYGTGLEVPGIEATLEYGDASTYARGRIPRALLINDRSKPDQVRVTDIAGLHDDPDVTDSRTERAGHWGERAGLLVPRGKTIGITGYVRSGNVPRMRDLWRRMRAQFGRDERDLIIHPPGEAPHYVNQAWSSPTNWSASAVGGGVISGLTAFTDGLLSGITVTSTSSATGSFQLLPVTLTPLMPSWRGEDIWVSAVVRSQAAPATLTSIKLAVLFYYYDPLNIGATTITIVPLTGLAVINSPTTGTYYQLFGRISPSTTSLPLANYVGPVILAANPASAGAYTLRAARIAMTLLNADDPSPLGYMDGSMPGFEWEGAPTQSHSYGPCYAANQFADPDSTSVAPTWANDSTSGATVDVAGVSAYGWPDAERAAVSWAISNPNTTSRTLAVRYPATLADPGRFVVAYGRTYRVHLRLRVSESYAAGAAVVSWVDYQGTVIGTSTVDTFDPVAPGGVAQDVELDGVVTAPLGALRAYLRVTALTASTTTNNRLNLLISEPRFVDVSEYDPGASAAIDSTAPPEIGTMTPIVARSGPSFLLTPNGARRRIPRPFLLRSVRSIWDGKAPESQRNLMARRDFTMSLRASDPRVYAIDERHSLLRIAGTSSLVSSLMSAFKAFLTNPPTVVASDGFVGTTAGSALNGRVAPLGGTWVTGGEATDLAFADNFNGTDGVESIARSTAVAETVGRYAVLGSTNYTDVQIDARVSSETKGHQQSLQARWTKANTYLRLHATDLTAGTNFKLVKVVEGVETTIKSTAWWMNEAIPYRLRLTVFSSGQAIGEAFSDDGVVLKRIHGFDSELATGGALEAGLPGYKDVATPGLTTGKRTMTEFVVSVPVSPYAAPPSFTYDGQSLDRDVLWRSSSLGAPYPLDGVTLGPSEDFPPASGYLSQDSLARMYYSSGSITYTTPQVTVSGNCINGSGFDYDLFADSLIGGVWQYNYIGALLKRVSTGTWIEARFNSANSVQMNSYHASPAAPRTLELWSSHDASGASGATKLASWDVPVGNIIDGHRKHLRAYLDASNIVWVELWDFGGPNFVGSGLIARQSFALSSPLITLYGAAVAGRSGAIVRLARWDDGTHAGIDVGTMQLNYDTPYLSTYESNDFATASLFLSCPVIGDADDVPVRIQLRGDIDTPTITLANIDTGKVAALMLSGKFLESDPVTIDMDAGTIKSDGGVDYFSRRISGSRFFSFEPGLNVLAIQATGWDASAPAHVIASWRDALR